MLAARILARVSRSSGARSLILSSPKLVSSPAASNHFHSLSNGSPIKLVPIELSVLHSSLFQRLGFASSASPEPSDKEKEGSPVSDETKGAAGEESDVADEAKESGLDSDSHSTQTDHWKQRRLGTKRTAFSDSDSDSDSEVDELSKEEMAKLLAENKDLLKVKEKEIADMKDKVVRTLAEMENVMARTRREAENSKKFAVQSFAKSLLDVADNLGRASSHVKSGFSKIDESKDTTGAAPLMKTLLEGVEMTEKQLAEVFRKFGVEKYDPINEPFDPNRHNAAFEVPDNSKPPGTVAHVLKAGYMLYDRVIRPADVGVTRATEENEDGGTEEKSS